MGGLCQCSDDHPFPPTRPRSLTYLVFGPVSEDFNTLGQACQTNFNVFSMQDSQLGYVFFNLPEPWVRPRAAAALTHRCIAPTVPLRRTKRCFDPPCRPAGMRACMHAPHAPPQVYAGVLYYWAYVLFMSGALLLL